ncbi:Hpt domain-containing protein [Flavobacterium sp. 7A]|uniref:Hpt domain-containing protein n=1 Tax=Flavobacterium sp. 7A TaxID=2940571 RepID=UPI0022267124|nr:Hpt domain-containing protein [Flavobacterium sp. 7A]MCW2118131.1 HPt (histidine-containing phosphotransfer) domain-containing protein [Flavobacterium sp. 7A]
MENPNLDYINKLSGDNNEFKFKLITILKKEFPLEIEQYFKELEDNNFSKVALAVHKLKHKISILGLEKSYYIASDYEDNLKNNSLILQDEFQNILKNIQEFVIQL